MIGRTSLGLPFTWPPPGARTRSPGGTASAGIPVVLGGLHVSALPEEALQHADAIAVGEAHETWPAVVADAARGRLQPRYERFAPVDSAGASVEAAPAGPRAAGFIPSACRLSIPNRTYLTRNSLLATRGCNRHCAFCYRSSQPDSPFRRRPVQEVLEEVRQMEGACFVLLDDNLAANRGYARRLFGALRAAGKVWMGAASIDVARDTQLLDLMAESGCCSLFVGLESIQQQNLNAMGKSFNCVALYSEYVRRIRTRGIMVNGSFIFGFDTDDAGIFDRTTAWAQQARVDTATFHILTPYPGTPLFAQMEREGRILDRDWAHYDTAHVVFRPRRMSPEELEAGYERAYDRFYTWPAILKRIAADRWGRLPRLMLSVGYKRMNPIWPALSRTGLTAIPFRAFVAALRHHRNSWRCAPEVEGAALQQEVER